MLESSLTRHVLLALMEFYSSIGNLIRGFRTRCIRVRTTYLDMTSLFFPWRILQSVVSVAPYVTTGYFLRCCDS